MDERHRDSTKEWAKENRALKKMTDPTPYKEKKNKVPDRKT